MSDIKDIGDIGNYYGGLSVRVFQGNRYQWSIENWDGSYWEDIPKSLYDALCEFEDERKKAE